MQSFDVTSPKCFTVFEAFNKLRSGQTYALLSLSTGRTLKLMYWKILELNIILFVLAYLYIFSRSD